MTVRRVILGVGAWVLAVVTVASVSWVAINSAGQQVTSTSLSAESLQGLPSGGATPRSAPTPFVDDDVPTPSTPSGTSSIDEAVSTTSSVSSSSSSSSSRPSSSSSSKSWTSSGSTKGKATWLSRGGQVIATCTGTQIALTNAVPYSGWTVKAHGSQTQIEVEFRNSREEIKVDVVCRGGTPLFQSSGEGGRD
jgi:hypothetical protein